jgi:hypothetical protein
VKHPRKSPLEKTYRWIIYRLRGTPAAYIGSVYAKNEVDAIKAAIEEFQITDPSQQKRLMAQRGE